MINFLKSSPDTPIMGLDIEEKFQYQELPNRMLVILVHPDDESFAVGGTLAKYADHGIQVILLTATRGEIGIPGLAPGKAGAIREQELRRAAEHLGIEFHFLDYQDGELSQEDSWKFLSHIAGWIDTMRPQVILTFGPDGVSGHPDHVTISNIVTQAVRKFFPGVCLLYIAPSEATVMGCGVMTSSADLKGALISVDISDYKLKKIRAIQSHVSQHPSLRGKAEDEMDKVRCHEYFTVAHSRNDINDLNGCFNLDVDIAGQLV